MLTDDTFFILVLLRWSREQVEGVGSGGGGQKQREEVEERGPDRQVCSFFLPLFLAPEAIQDRGLRSTVGLAELARRWASRSSRGDTGCCLA